MTNGSTDCVFCKVLRGQLPAAVVFENERTLGFRPTVQRSPSLS